MKLFYSNGTIARAVYVALHEASVECEIVKVHFDRAQQRQSAYLSINPKGRVPALITPSGILTETPAILTYIAQTYPKANLAPTADAYAFAKLQEFTTYLAATVHVAHAHRLRGNRWANLESSFADMQTKVAQNMTDALRIIESEYLRGPWVCGEQFSLADAYLFPISEWLERDGADLRNLPKLAEYRKNIRARASIQALFAMEDDDADTVMLTH